jgi:hypothetical protein
VRFLGDVTRLRSTAGAAGWFARGIICPIVHLGVISATCLVTVVYVSYWPPVRSVHPHRLASTGQPRSHAWVAMQVETKFLRLFREVAIGDRINGWGVCWIGGWDKCRVVFVVMVETHLC